MSNTALALLRGYSPPWDTDALARTVADAIVAAGSAIVAPPTALVFRPGGVQGGNVYTNWADCCAAAASIAGPKTIFFDNTIVAGAITLPAGAYDLGQQCTFKALDRRTADTALPLRINVPDLTTFTGLVALDDVLFVFSTVAGGVVNVASGILIFRMLGHCQVAGTSTGALISATGTGVALVDLNGTALIFTNNAGPTLASVGAAAFCAILLWDSAQLQQNTIGGTVGGGTTVDVRSTGARWAPVQAAMPGATVVPTIGTLASNQGVVDTAGNVYGATNVQTMTDAIKERLSGTVANIADAAATTINIAGGRWRYIAAVSQDTSITCDPTGGVDGDEIVITRGTNEAFFVRVLNGAGVELARIAALGRGSFRVHRLLGQYVLKEAGACL